MRPSSGTHSRITFGYSPVELFRVEKKLLVAGWRPSLLGWRPSQIVARYWDKFPFVFGSEMLHQSRTSNLQWQRAESCAKLACGQNQFLQEDLLAPESCKSVIMAVAPAASCTRGNSFSVNQVNFPKYMLINNCTSAL